jgi:hypothetical protein
VRITLEPDSPGAAAVTGESDDSGEFLIQVSAPGTYRLRLRMTGFASVAVGRPFAVSAGATSVFDEPFVMKVGATRETVTLDSQPRSCRRARPRAGAR